MTLRRSPESITRVAAVQEQSGDFLACGKTTGTPTPHIQRSCSCGSSSNPSDKCASCVAGEQLGGQPKLAVGPENDIYEQEADRIAEQVVAGDSEPAPSSGAVTQVQRHPFAEGKEMLPPGAGASAAAAVSSGGQPLSRSERAFFEPRFGHDLSHVRLHTGSNAGRSAAAINARAYTLHNNIAFASGEYQPQSREGRRLIAHELTHTLQQGSSNNIRRVPAIPGMDDNPRRRDPFAFPDQPPHMDDPRGPGHSTLTYAQSRELSRCIEVMGDDAVARAECAHTVLGTPLPEWRSVAGISSPVPFRSHVSSAGAATFRIGRVNLTILPDTHSDDPAMQGRAETEIRQDTMAAGTHLVEAETMNGRVTSFTVNPAAFSFTIQTTYGPGVTAASTSGYGRGTTETDERAGSTSLGFHEGEHSRAFIDFLRNNPYPEFTGRNDQSAAAFSSRITQFETALQDYVRRMNRASVLATDCVGTTIDNYNAANGTATTICVVSPGNP